MNGIETAFAGTLGRDPELRRVKDGTLAMLSMSVAVNVRRKDDDATQWLRVVIFGARADELSGTLTKGSKIYVEGTLTLDTWTAKDGAERHGLSVIAWRIEPLSQIGARRPRQEPSKREASSSAPAAVTDTAPFDDGIPF